MSINSRQVCDAIATVADKNLQVATKGSILVGAICGAGGVLLGPVGLVVGGFLGGFFAMSMAMGTFRSVGELITKGLTDGQREELAQRVMNVVGKGGRDNNITNVASLLLFIYSNREILQEVLKVISNFFGGQSTYLFTMGMNTLGGYNTGRKPVLQPVFITAQITSEDGMTSCNESVSVLSP